eukprot:9269877-Pyramimonas_sp.AAC.1
MPCPLTRLVPAWVYTLSSHTIGSRLGICPVLSHDWFPLGYNRTRRVGRVPRPIVHPGNASLLVRWAVRFRSRRLGRRRR